MEIEELKKIKTPLSFVETGELVNVYDTDGPAIRMSHALTNAAHDLDWEEKRLILVAIAKVLDSKIKKNHWIRITTKDIIKACPPGIDRHDANKFLRDAASSLIKKQVTFNESYADGDSVVRTVNWMQEKVEKPKGGDYVDILFTDRVYRNFVGLTTEYTYYKLRAAMLLSSKHSIRLFELLMQWSSVGKLRISRDEFDKALGLPDSYGKYHLHQSKIIDPCIADIEQQLGLIVTFTKESGNIFVFTFEQRPKADDKNVKAVSYVDETPNLMMMKAVVERFNLILADTGFANPETIARKANEIVKDRRELEKKRANKKTDKIENGESL